MTTTDAITQAEPLIERLKVVALFAGDEGLAEAIELAGVLSECFKDIRDHLTYVRTSRNDARRGDRAKGMKAIAEKGGGS